MKLEVSKFYKTRDGRKAYVAAIGSPFAATGTSSQAIGWVDGDNGYTAWDAGGLWISSHASPYDLVEPYVDHWDYEPQPGDEFVWARSREGKTFILSTQCLHARPKSKGYRYAKCEVSPAPPLT